MVWILNEVGWRKPSVGVHTDAVQSTAGGNGRVKVWPRALTWLLAVAVEAFDWHCATYAIVAEAIRCADETRDAR